MTNAIMILRVQVKTEPSPYVSAGVASTVLVRKTEQGWVNCDGQIFDSGQVVREASPAEARLFRECENESVTRLGKATPVSPKLQAVRSGTAQKPNMTGRATMIGVAPTGAGTPKPEPSRYRITDMEPEFLLVKR